MTTEKTITPSGYEYEVAFANGRRIRVIEASIAVAQQYGDLDYVTRLSAELREAAEDHLDRIRRWDYKSLARLDVALDNITPKGPQ